MPTPSNLAGRLTRYSMDALAAGSALAAKVHNVIPLGSQNALVSWQSDAPPDLSNTSIEDIRSYMFFLQNEHYSIVCNDGSIIQMSFKVKRGDIVHHRLCFLPCPVAFDQAELLQDSLYDVVERNLGRVDYDLIRYRGAIRFDYDPLAATDSHPSSHVTINFNETRVPVGRSLDARTFIKFVDRNFISNRENMKSIDFGMTGDDTPDVLASVDRPLPHLFWHI